MPRSNSRVVYDDALALYRDLDNTERQILACYVAGLSSETIATRFEFCAVTAEAHRARLMRKLRADTLIELLVRARTCNLATRVDSSIHIGPALAPHTAS